MAVGDSVLVNRREGSRLAAGHLTQAFLLGLVLLLGFGIRLYDLKDAPLDFHPTRQLRSAIIARGMFYQMDPSADPARRAQAVSIANTMEAYEPPIFEALVALTYRVIGQEVLWVSRIYSAVFWTIAGLALFALARRFASFLASLTGLMFFLFLPFAIIASRSFQPDPWMVMWLALLMWTAYRWSELGGWGWTVAAGITGGMAVLVKVVAVFPVGLMLLALVLFVVGIKKAVKNPWTWAIAGLVLLPSLVYYLFGLGQRSADFMSFWTLSLSHLVLTSHFYISWLGMLNGLIGLTMLTLGLFGILVAPRPARVLLSAGWAGYFLYGLVFPYQMTTHEYYHLMLLPLAALAIVPLVDLVFQKLTEQPWIWRAVAVGALAFASAYSLWTARSVLFVANYSNEVTAWTRMGQELPQNGRIIALTSEYGNRLKYYGWHSISGYWPFQADMALTALAQNGKMDYPSYFKSATEGMDYFLVTAFTEYEQQPELKALLEGRYPVALQGDGYILYDLRQPLSR